MFKSKNRGLHAIIIWAIFIGTSTCFSGQLARGETTTAATSPAQQMGPRLTFTASEWNFGTVFAGSPVKHAFLASNVGDQPLVISDVVPQCHCIMVEDWPRTIAPGKSAEILILLDTSALEGDVSKAVTVISNDPRSPTQTLSLAGTVRKPLEVSPPFASIQLAPDASTTSTNIVLVINHTGEPVVLSDPVSSSAAFKATLQTIKPGKEFEVAISATPPLPSGNTAGIVSLKTSWPNLPMLEITAVAMVQPVLEAAPWEIVLPRQIASWTTNLITITNNGTKAIALSAPKVSDPRANVDLKTIVPGRSFQLVAAFPPGFELLPGQSAQLSVNSDSTSRPVITVPIRQDSTGPAAAQPRPPIHRR